MARGKIVAAIGLVIVLALVSAAQTNERREGGSPPTMVMSPQPQPPGGPGPIPPMRMRELAEQLRARAREAQELSDRLCRQADELDQVAQGRMGGGPGPQQMEQTRRELDEIKEAIGRAEREGRRQEADELRRHAEQLMGRFQPMPSGPRMEERQEIKRQIERLREEAQRAKEQGRMEDSERVWKEADRLEQVLREQGPREGGEFGRPMLPEGERQEIKKQVERLRDEAQRAKDEGRVEDSRNIWQEAQRLEQKLREQGPRGDERQEMKRRIEDLRNEARKAKDQGRQEDADRLGKEADRLEQQLREQGPREKGEFGKPMPPEVQDILRAAEQAQREGRTEDARRQREKAEIVARQLQEQRDRRVFEQPGPRGDEQQQIKRKIEDLRNEAQKAKDEGRREDADRLWKEADRLEQQLREQGPHEKGEFGRPMPPEVQDILRSAEQAEREGRMEDARRQREKAEIVARQLKQQKGQGPEARDRSFKDEVIRSVEGLKKEIGRLWQAVNEMRNRPRENRPM